MEAFEEEQFLKFVVFGRAKGLVELLVGCLGVLDNEGGDCRGAERGKLGTKVLESESGRANMVDVVCDRGRHEATGGIIEGGGNRAGGSGRQARGMEGQFEAGGDHMVATASTEKGKMAAGGGFL